MPKRIDYVPARPIARALKEWLNELDLADEGDSATLARQGRYFSPYEILAQRTGMKVNTVYNHASGKRGYGYMKFDVADKLLCATERFHWWWTDPELSESYEEAVKGADKAYPLPVAA